MSANKVTLRNDGRYSADFRSPRLVMSDWFEEHPGIAAFIGIILVCLVLLVSPDSAKADPGYDRIKHCLALNTYWEASSSGEPAMSQYATALVVMNRAKRRRMDVCDVIFQRSQFSWAQHALDNRGVIRPEYRPPNNAAWQQAQAAAQAVLDGMPDFTHGATFYHSDVIPAPYWTAGLRQTGKWGRHIAYRRVAQ